MPSQKSFAFPRGARVIRCVDVDEGSAQLWHVPLAPSRDGFVVVTLAGSDLVAMSAITFEAGEERVIPLGTKSSQPITHIMEN